MLQVPVYPALRRLLVACLTMQHLPVANVCLGALLTSLLCLHSLTHFEVVTACTVISFKEFLRQYGGRFVCESSYLRSLHPGKSV